MMPGRRYQGSGAFLRSARGGVASPSASPTPEQVLKILGRLGTASDAQLQGELDASPSVVESTLRALETLDLVSSRQTENGEIHELTQTGRRALQLSYLAIA